MKQKNIIKNISNTACALLAASTMSISNTMVVSGSNFDLNISYNYANMQFNKNSNNVVKRMPKSRKKLGIELEADSLFGAMRDATKEEQESVEKYIDSISKDTGVNFFDLC